MKNITFPHADPRQHDESHFQKPELTADLAAHNPFVLFEKWYNEAQKTEFSDPNAMSLATIGSDNMPNMRIVLLKEFDADGFTFFTNYTSQKGCEISINPNVSLCFHWKSTLQQVRIQGIAEKISEAQSDAYFNSRDRNSQIGAWASAQSQDVSGRQELLERLEACQKKFSENAKIPRPPHWGGYIVRPLKIEYWQNGAFRLHDRLIFARENFESSWHIKKLYP